MFGVLICIALQVGWFTGIIVYFNRELKEYKVDYADKTSDYLSYSDFDGVEVILEPNCRQ